MRLQHNIKYRLLASLMGLAVLMSADAVPTHYDTESGNIQQLFMHGSGNYVLRYHHEFNDTLYIPNGCELRFEGGGLTGPIVFKNTFLNGKVNLRGAHIFGNVCNATFDASWICTMDGVTDDAVSINEMIAICNNIFFPRGTYRLTSTYKQEKFHIGIHQDDVALTGEEGTVFLTKEHLGMVCVFSKPYDIEGSVRNIRLKGITFRTVNDGSEFLQWTHAIQLMGVNGFVIEDCTIEDFWGDGICLDHYGDTPETGERARNQNVRIENCTITGGSHNNRNGISVINGQNVVIKGNTIRSTSRKDMPGAIDVEPNNSAYTIESIWIIGNKISGSRGSCGAIELCMFDGGPGHHIYVEDNDISNSNLGIYIYLKTDDTTEHFVIRNNHVAADTPPYKFVGNGKSKNWIIGGNRFERSSTQSIPGDLQIENLRLQR